jgi:hypothetical protein
MEVVRRFVEASVRRDRDAFVALLDPEFKGFPLRMAGVRPGSWARSGLGFRTRAGSALGDGCL